MTAPPPLTQLDGPTAVREAVRRVHAGEATVAQVLGQLTGAHLEQVLHAQFSGGGAAPIARGIGASPGAAVGRAYFSADAAVEAADRGELVVLVRQETTPDDIHGMQVAEGILTSRGGLASHAAVVARGWGIPAVVGAEAVEVGDAEAQIAGATVRAGDLVSLDGATGEVWLGERTVTDAADVPELDEVLGWADEVRGTRMAVRANADTSADAAQARRLGAQGIGLCRTEHMFLADDRLPVVRRMLLAHTPEAEAAALAELHDAQLVDFQAILTEMAGLPVTVRLLDPPLHEFLPSVEELRVAAASRAFTDDEEQLLRAAEALREQNPMLGVRGVRLGVLKPGLYAMQVRALLDAAARVDGAIVEVMIPLTVARAELALARGWVEDAIAAAAVEGRELAVTIGTMIETPRAALRAGELAEVADFFSFGTNDLTQLTFGFSRDDVEARLVPAYLAEGLLPANPFETLDAEGVGELVALAIERGRASRPDLKLGVCGEHGGDPASIATFVRLGLDYVSCSPYRVPIARLAIAQAMLAGRGDP
jgi:pyruvate,orthophosphate dikinase